MIKSERIQLLNEHILWELSSTMFGETKTYQTFDGVTNAARTERKHWKNLEGDSTVLVTFSTAYSELESLLSEIARQVDASFPDTVQTIVAKCSESTPIDVTFYRGHRNGISGRWIIISLKAPRSTELYEGVLKYAYQQLYLKGDEEGFLRLAGLAKGQKTLQGLINNAGNDNIDTVVQFLGIQMREKAFPNQNQFVKSRIADLSDEISAAKDQLADLRQEAYELVDNSNQTLRANLETRELEYSQFKMETESWIAAEQGELGGLKNTYEENLRLSAPVKFWEKKAESKNKSFRIWFCITIGISVALLLFVYWLFSMTYVQTTNTINQIIPLSFIIVALIAVLIYAVMTLVKIMMAERHLSTEFEEKAAFTHFYLSLLQNEGVEIRNEERLLIYSAIFARVDTGLIKSTNDPNVGVIDLLKTISR
ncbi:MAG: DUF6161 domain-containing protein [Coriobacteriia bacterium]|nr:DUF6161 domain-containing protein [Coriobacteriia bacterium]